MITVWTTKRRLNHVICKSFWLGLKRNSIATEIRPVAEYCREPVDSVSYGFLRGVAQIYRDCATSNTNWWNIDKGFFRASHLDGYYRIGKNHLQPLYDGKLFVDDSRWKKLNIDVKPLRMLKDGCVLVCPPTPALSEFYGIREQEWIENTIERIPAEIKDQIVIRKKVDPVPLETVLPVTRVVVTHSSNVAMEALVQGIPAISETGIIQTWNRLNPEDATISIDAFSRFDRQALLNQASWNQFTLAEIERGYAWQVLQNNKRLAE